MKKLICPNCMRPVARSNDGCLLHDLIQVARERGNVTERKLRQLHAKADADALWERLGPIVDDLEDGNLSEDDKPQPRVGRALRDSAGWPL
jgi:hypothetical protein